MEIHTHIHMLSTVNDVVNVAVDPVVATCYMLSQIAAQPSLLP